MTVRLVNISQFLADQHHAEMRTKLAQRATEAKWPNFFEGVPCTFDVKEFAEEVRKVMPSVKFLPIDTDYAQQAVHDADGNYQTSNSIRVFNEYAVYLDEFPFDIGRINHKDNGARKNNAYTYGIYSRKITNAKYAYHRDQHHMVTATDLKKAIKKVSQYFIPYSTKELAQAFYEPIKDNVNQAILTLERELRSKVELVVNDRHELIREIQALKQQGVQFKSSKFREVAENMGDVVERFDAENNRNTGAIFVRFYKVGGETYFSTQQAIEVKKHHHQLQGTEEGKIEGKPVSEIPEDVMGAVSVLSILNDRQYVTNVGMKLDSNHFWIERG